MHGATGAQRSPALSALRAVGKDAVAAVRNTASVPDGVDAVSVDLTDSTTLAAAYTGAEGVFIHLPMGSPEKTAAIVGAIPAAIAAARPGRVVISTSGMIVDEPESPLQAPDDSPIATLIRETKATGVSTAVVAPRLYLENLLMPSIAGPAREDGVLRYPLPASFPVSWSSHLDVADVVVRLLTDTAVTEPWQSDTPPD
ncbi:SDR family oxidoreductase [Streptomyces sp. B21-101]|uniref:SDR family oxidoreductase n=1 Tax=Streptomyces sp. B21-101 TaxID=3039415 RepID=UPI002FF4368C